jgi:hypothetical protein
MEMTKIAKSTANVLITLACALCLTTGAQAQANAAQQPAPSNTKPSAASAAKPSGTPAVKTVSARKDPAGPKQAAVKPAKLAVPAKPAATPKPTPAPKPVPAPKAPSKIIPTGMTASPDQPPTAVSPAEAFAGKRDPFVSLVNDRKEGGGPALPPGKAGLVVATVRVDGTVRSGNELLAVVSNPERHVYFVRIGDQLYDGSVERIDLDGVTFHEDSKDAFGKPVVREVTKRIYASAGEQQ